MSKKNVFMAKRSRRHWVIIIIYYYYFVIFDCNVMVADISPLVYAKGLTR